MPERHIEGIEHEPRVQVVGHGLPDHTAAEGIQYDGEVQEHGPSGDAGDVRDPQPIGFVAAEVALSQIRRRLSQVAAIAGLTRILRLHIRSI